MKITWMLFVLILIASCESLVPTVRELELQRGETWQTDVLIQEVK